MVHEGPPDWPGGVAADTTLYRDNAFRIAGLPVTATPRQVRRRTDRLRAAESLGTDEQPVPTLLPPRPTPDHASVREALRRLENPLVRLSDEFLWFWPLPGTDDVPDPDAAPTAWRTLADGPPGAAGRSTALHNLAVLAHAVALEEAAVPHAGLRADQWLTAYAYWRQVLADEGCWEWLDQRIRALDDPRLRGWSSDRLRRALPALLLGAHARLVVAWAAEGADPGLHIALMREFQPAQAADRALRRAVDPLATRITFRYEREKLAADEPDAHDRSAAALLAETKADLRVLRAVLGAGHPLVQDSADAVASAVHLHAVRCANQSAEAEPARRGPRLDHSIEHLRRARGLAATRHVRAPIERDLAVLLANVLGLACQEAAEQGERFPGRGAEYAHALMDAAGPRLRMLDELTHVEVEELDRTHLADNVAAVACILLVGYQRATREDDVAREGLQAALAYAQTRQTRWAIERQLTALAANARAASRHVGPPGSRTAQPHGQPTVRLARPGTCLFCGAATSEAYQLFVGTVDGRENQRGPGVPCCATCRETRVKPPGTGRAPTRSDVAPARRAGCAMAGGRLLIFLGVLAFVVALFLPRDAKELWTGIGAGVLLLGLCLRYGYSA